MDILKRDGYLPPEIEEGNIEYKRHLDHVKLTDHKYKKLSSQLLWRIDQNVRRGLQSEAIYYIGIDDNGYISGIDLDQIIDSITMLKSIAHNANPNIKIISENIHTFDNGVVAEIILRIMDNVKKDEKRICLLGDTNSGKSTLISVLCYNIPDNGNGSSRNYIFKHDHELENGLTSSIKHDIVGIKGGTLINYSTDMIKTWKDIVKKSDTIIELIDLPGHSKYYKTLIYGLSASNYDLVLIVIDISNDNGDNGEYYKNICNMLNIPYKIIYTKIDLIDNPINDNQSIYISNVNKSGFSNLISFLDKINKNIPNNRTNGQINDKIDCQVDSKMDCKIEFIINEVFNISDVGIVVAGILNSGKIMIHDKLLIGPIQNKFINVSIISIHRKQISSKYITKGESGSLVLQYKSNIPINNNMVIISENMINNYILEFYVKLYQQTNIHNLYLIVNIGNVCAKVLFLNIRDNTFYKCIFSDGNPRYIADNKKIIIRYISIIFGDVLVKINNI